MRNGSCIKCSAETVYFSNAMNLKNGLLTDSGYPRLNIYKDNKWIPDIDSSQMNSYVCRTCGYFEMFVRDLSILTKLDDCDNWQKLEAN
jgi:hypothetical protein